MKGCQLRRELLCLMSLMSPQSSQPRVGAFGAVGAPLQMRNPRVLLLSCIEKSKEEKRKWPRVPLLWPREWGAQSCSSLGRLETMLLPQIQLEKLREELQELSQLEGTQR